MKFSFKADVDGLLLTFTAERIYRSKQSERFKLTIAGTQSEIVIQNNRPLVEEKKSGKKVQWHIVEGKAEEKERWQNVYQQLERFILHPPPIVQGTLNFIDHF